MFGTFTRFFIYFLFFAYVFIDKTIIVTALSVIELVYQIGDQFEKVFYCYLFATASEIKLLSG